MSPIAAQPGTGVLIPYYDENGFRSKPFGPIRTSAPYNLGLVGPKTGSASNGTAHLSLHFSSSFEVFSLDGLLFDAVAVDLAEYSTVFPFPKVISFEGILNSGASVFVDFSIDGFVQGGAALNDFETFTFPNEFSGLTLLRSATTPYCLDNLVLSVIPEPTSLLMVCISLVGIVSGRTCRPS